LTISYVAPPTRLYVNANAAGTGDGLTWATAFSTVQQATTYPNSVSVTEIFVAGGLYTPTATLSMKNNVGIYGGFAGVASVASRTLTYPLSTTISGGGARQVFNNSNLNNTAILDGFVIARGNDINGGGMYNFTSNPIIRNCFFQGNSANDKNGGAIFNESSDPIIFNCSFQGNSAGRGGAIYNFSGTATITNCVFFGNTNTFSGALTATYCLFDASVTGYTDGGNNLTTTVSPFVSATDLRLNACAPAINAGNSSATGLTGITTDLGGNPRIFGSAVDMGAFEFQGAANSPVVITAQPAGSSVLCGTGQTVTVSGGATGTISGYQWYKDAVSLGTAQQAPTLTLTGVTTASSGNYALVIIGGCGNVSTTDFRLTVNPLPVVSVVNSGSSSCVGVASLSVVSAPAGYQINWLNGGNLAFAGLPQSITAGVTVAGGNGNGNGANQLGYPSGVFVDATGAAYIVDNNNHRVQKWAVGATAGITVAGGNGSGSAANQLKEPYGGLHVDGDGAVYVVDNSNHRIQKWAVGATAGTTVAGGNGFGSAANQLNKPTGVYVDAAGAVYVADRLNSRVQKWAAGATSGITVAGGNGRGTNPNQLSRPSGVFVDGAGAVYIADQGVGAHRVQKWAAGATVGTTVAGGNGKGSGANQLDDPTGVYVDAFGAVYVSDYNHRIQKWAVGATSGTTVAGDAAGIRGNTADKLRDPEGVFVDRDGAIYVSDGSNDRIQKWAAPTASPVYSPTVAGSYTVRVTTAAGCSALSTNAVVVSTPVSITAQPVASSVVCAGGAVTASVSVTGTGPLSYQWYKDSFASPVASQTTATLSLTGLVTADAGSYSVVVTGACGSVTSTAFSLSVNSAPTNPGLTGGTLTCGTPSLTLTASATNGTSFIFSGGTPLGTNQVVVSQAGPYTVTVSNANGCTATTSTTVDSNTAAPSASILPTSATLTCSSPAVSLTASGSGTYRWDDNTTNAIRSVSASGTYSVTVTATNGCTATASVAIDQNITPPPATLVSSGTLTCSTTSVTLTANTGMGLSYVFSGGATQLGSINQARVATPGTYTVTITGANGCTATATVMVFSNTVVPTVSISPSSATLTCASPTVSLTAVVSGTVLWSTGQTTPVITVNSANTYSVTVTGSNGCTATAPAQVFSNTAAPTASILPISATLTCSSPAVSLTASGGGSYVWDNNSTNAIRSVSAPGPYSVTVTGTNGCTATATASVVSNTAAPTASLMASSLTFCSGSAVTLTASSGTGYAFSGPGLSQSGASNTATASQAGSYSVIVSGANGCTASAGVSLTVNPLPSAPTLTSVSRTFAASPTPLPMNQFVSAAGVLSFSGVSGLLSPAQADISSGGIQSFSVSQTNGNGCVSLSTPFSITVVVLPPGSQTVCRGSRVVLSVGLPGLRYQWYINGQTVAFELDELRNRQIGTKTASLTLASVQTTASYYVKVTGANGSVVWGGPFRVVVDFGCTPPGARVASGEEVAEVSLDVVLTPNPLADGMLRAVVSGAGGHPLVVELVDLWGRWCVRRRGRWRRLSTRSSGR